MKGYLYSIYDKVAEEFGPPFLANNDKVACRKFDELIRQVYTKNDFDMYRLGFVDTDLINISSPGDSDAFLMQECQKIDFEPLQSESEQSGAVLKVIPGNGKEIIETVEDF